MKSRASGVAIALARLLSLVFLAGLGTVALMRFAPGYFSDERELDGQYAGVARAELKVQEDKQGSMTALSGSFLRGWFRGDFGQSRQFDVPVAALIRTRAFSSAKLLLCGVGCGWSLAIVLALPLSIRQGRGGEILIGAPMAVLLAIPISVMATACLLADAGGPLLVLALLVGVRDFKFVYRLLRHNGANAHILYARAQGIPSHRIAWIYLFSALVPELRALASMSFVIALSALVPVEVVFNLPGLGQLAWSAAMNRDLPVLLGVTLVMAACIAATSAMASPEEHIRMMPCD